MNLKWLLVRRITLVALACFLAGSALALYGTARETKRQNVDLADLVGRQLNLQLSRIDRSTDIATRFPDWGIIASQSLRPGQCVEYRDADAVAQRTSCTGVDAAQTSAPAWFFEAYRSLINDHLTATQDISYRGVSRGSVLATFDPAATASQAWSTIAPLLGLSAALVAALCVVTYFVVDRALRPTKDILAGLNRLAQGDLSCRLPEFHLSELNRISEVFNALSEELNKVTGERAELARKLIDSQEQERRHLARELHDEIAQKLSALNALAACIRTSAQRDMPALVSEARNLEEMASALMITLRRTLNYLRPQEIDDLGLVQGLKALVDQHNQGAHGRTHYSIETTGEVEQLHGETSAHVYRIVQEALTNVAKHANARNVKVQLTQHSVIDQERIRLSVVDDGSGVSGNPRPSTSGGAGLIGMRERVVALSGDFVAGPLPNGGFGLQVEFPTQQRGA